MDVATPQLWAEAVFGLTSGWWRFSDRDLRPVHPLLGRSQWETVLGETGFNETTSLPGLMLPQGEGQIGILARKAWQAPPTRARGGSSSGKIISYFCRPGRHWFLLAERLRAAVFVVELSSVEPRSQRKIRHLRAKSRSAGRLEPTFAACAGEAVPERIIYLWNLDARLDHDATIGTDALLHLVQTLETDRPSAKLRIDSVTRGAQPVGRETKATTIAQAPAIGLMRVILNEYPNLVCRGIDLPPTPSAAEPEVLWTELLRAEPEREVALRGEARYVQRLDRGRPRIEQSLDPALPLRLESRERGQLDALKFAPFAQPSCGAGEVMIEAKAAGMNFRDVLKALALYPGTHLMRGSSATRSAGIVTAVGLGVTHVAPGDRVFGLAVSDWQRERCARQRRAAEFLRIFHSRKPPLYRWCS